MLAEGLAMDQVGQELGMSSEEIFAATLSVAKRASGSFSWNKHNLHKLFCYKCVEESPGHISS